MRKIIIFFIIICAFGGNASAWLSSYDHRMPLFVFNGESLQLTDYQFEFTTDTNVLVAAGHMQASGADCRVTDASDNLIPFWNETAFNITNTTVWANATLAVGYNLFYMYYGNPGASDVTNISTTFMFGDDFNSWKNVEVGSTGNTWSRTRNIDIKDNYAYVCTNSYFRVVDITDPTNPNQVASIAISGDTLECKISGNESW